MAVSGWLAVWLWLACSGWLASCGWLVGRLALLLLALEGWLTVAWVAGWL